MDVRFTLHLPRRMDRKKLRGELDALRESYALLEEEKFALTIFT